MLQTCSVFEYRLAQLPRISVDWFPTFDRFQYSFISFIRGPVAMIFIKNPEVWDNEQRVVLFWELDDGKHSKEYMASDAVQQFVQQSSINCIKKNAQN
jgi:hypothetical protein